MTPPTAPPSHPADDVLPGDDVHPRYGASLAAGRRPAAGHDLPEPLPDAASPHPIPAVSGLAPAASLSPPFASLGGRRQTDGSGTGSPHGRRG